MRMHAQKQNQPQQQASPNIKRSSAHPLATSRVQLIPYLQRTIGNQAVQRLLQANKIEVGSPTAKTNHIEHALSLIPLRTKTHAGIQAGLTVNTPGDVDEQEADRVAEQGLHTSDTRLQRACACGGECTACKTETLSVGAKPAQLKRNQSTEIATPPFLQKVPHSPGQPLDAEARSFFEPRFGHDFSQVQVHVDKESAKSARVINARAYTFGQNIVFGIGQYQPKSENGRKLLAHELTHVVQQTSGFAPASLQRDPGDRNCEPPTAQQLRRLIEEVNNAPARLRELARDPDRHLGVPLQPTQRQNFRRRVMEVIQLTRQFLTDYRRGNLRLCVDAASCGNAEACYFPYDETIWIKPRVFEAEDLLDGTATVLHEYSHYRQDRSLLRRVVRTERPILQGPIDELIKEYEGNLVFEILRRPSRTPGAGIPITGGVPPESAPATHEDQNEGAGTLRVRHGGDSRQRMTEETIPPEVRHFALDNPPERRPRALTDLPHLEAAYRGQIESSTPAVYYQARLDNGSLYLRSITRSNELSLGPVGEPNDPDFRWRIQNAFNESSERLNAESIGYRIAHIVVFTGRSIITRVMVSLQRSD